MADKYPKSQSNHSRFAKVAVCSHRFHVWCKKRPYIEIKRIDECVFKPCLHSAKLFTYEGSCGQKLLLLLLYYSAAFHLGNFHQEHDGKST